MTFSHLSKDGDARMVDVGDKTPSRRVAVAESRLALRRETILALNSKNLPKGDALAAARIAGILAAKHTHTLIPLCHPLPLDNVRVALRLRNDHVQILAAVSLHARTGAEMEALTAASVAALALYDMVKSVDRSAVIQSTQLLHKTGGNSGDYTHPDADPKQLQELLNDPGTHHEPPSP